MNRTVRVLLDGHEAHGFPGQTILSLCADCGIEIPTLCHDPHLSPHGGCSLCLVDVKGARTLVRACVTELTPGMEIRTNTDRVRRARKTDLELLLSDHVGDCRPPCTLACPARGDVQGYVNLAAQGKYTESLAALHENVTLPASIGRVCPAPCEEVCRRNFVDDEPVSIREIKRFVGDWCLAHGDLGTIPLAADNGRSVAIVGGGPAGLSAAYYLRRLGYAVTLYEKEAHLGGMMRYGIPDYRLPPAVLQAEIDWILAHGIGVRTGTALGRDVTLDELREGYDAVLLALGCWRSSSLRVPGEDLPGVLPGIGFLYEVNAGRPPHIGRRVAVIGGGNTAMDAARCARRLGADEVTVVYRRSRAEMPAQPIEVEEAMEEGIEFAFLAAPKAIEGTGKVERLLCERMELGEPDASGRRQPVPTGETFQLVVDTVIAAVGQAADLSALPRELHDGRWPKVDDHYATPIPGVFACGDLRTGPDIAIGAIGEGHWAALSIHRYLTVGEPRRPYECDVVQRDLGPKDFADRPRIPREHPGVASAADRLGAPWGEFNAGLAEDQVLRDAARCMECGCPDLHECKLRRYSVEYEASPDRYAGAHVPRLAEANPFYDRNMDKCVLCGRCVRACDEIAGFHAIDFVRRGFEGTIGAEFLRPIETAECTGCGMCVQLCPVGALVEKRLPRRVHSARLRAVATHCGECPVGCDLLLDVEPLSGRIVRVRTDLDAVRGVSFGNACARGRLAPFNLHEGRLEQPLLRLRGRAREVGWSEFLDKVSSFVRGGIPGTAILAAADLASEDYRALHDLVGTLPGPCLVAVDEVATTAPLWAGLAERGEGAQAGLAELREADLVLLLGAHLEEEQPVLASWIRLSMRRSRLRVVAVGGNLGRLARGDTLWFDASPADQARVLAALRDCLHGERSSSSEPGLGRAADRLKEGKRIVVLIGSELAADESGRRALADLLESVGQPKLIPLYRGANVRGARALAERGVSAADVAAAVRAGTVRTLFAVGADPLDHGLTEEDLRKLDCYVLLHSFRTRSLSVARAAAPSARWLERDGTFENLTGATLSWKAAAVPPGAAKPLPWIVAGLVRRLGASAAPRG
ncbi:MAG: Glutamate synthase [NADPH] small chain [Candidatus Bipolaricaulis sibiricus]|uniref:Glutamate synthase [NADPH] small chain n=1 Tax=Bipolaricaulis sibiricus TaxID=2501609 RepID=A0A410FTD2_BIPS1|nr:MAG: Glutamate synthase [NADPH] small chain [Candidatus Bipolaricaulis sibiricus]